MPTSYILIDYENVQPDILPLLKQEHIRLIVFVGPQRKSVPFELASAMQRLGSRAIYVRLMQGGPNALDFCIAFYLGALVVRDATANFYVISKDTGFDPLIMHLQRKQLNVYRYGEVEAIPGITSSPQSSQRRTSFIARRAVESAKAQTPSSADPSPSSTDDKAGPACQGASAGSPPSPAAEPAGGQAPIFNLPPRSAESGSGESPQGALPVASQPPDLSPAKGDAKSTGSPATDADPVTPASSGVGRFPLSANSGVGGMILDIEAFIANIIYLFKAHPKFRPRTAATLKNYVIAHLGRYASEQAAIAVISALQQRGVLAINSAGKVTYLFTDDLTTSE